MKKKNFITLCVILTLITSYFTVTTVLSRKQEIDSKSKIQIENTINSYLMNKDDSNYDIPQNIEIKFDKKSNIYTAVVSFEDTEQKMNIFISKDNAILGSANE